MTEIMNVIHSMDEFVEATNHATSVFVFSANWCPDCRFIEPFMPELMEKYKEYSFYYVDRDECIDVCQELGVLGIPSFVCFSNGEEVDRFVSRFRKTKDEIDTFLAGIKNGKGEA